MEDLSLNQKVIQKIKEETPEKVKKLMGNDLKKVILYGSCARGNYTADSDIDIALITAGDRMSVKKYSEELAQISTEFAIKFFAIVNFVCLPESEYADKKDWYGYFRNIAGEGEVLYG